MDDNTDMTALEKLQKKIQSKILAVRTRGGFEA